MQKQTVIKTSNLVVIYSTFLPTKFLYIFCIFLCLFFYSVSLACSAPVLALMASFTFNAMITSSCCFLSFICCISLFCIMDIYIICKDKQRIWPNRKLIETTFILEYIPSTSTLSHQRKLMLSHSFFTDERKTLTESQSIKKH